MWEKRADTGQEWQVAKADAGGGKSLKEDIKVR